MNKKQSLTFTIIANMTANYGESLGNISQIQKVYIDGVAYSKRSWESIKSMLIRQAGWDDNLEVVDNKSVATKLVGTTQTIKECKSLEGGYMYAKKNETTYTKSSALRITDAIATTPYVSDYQFHNNLKLAKMFAEKNNKNPENCGLMPYNYEYEKTHRIYSVTIFLDEIGEDKNFNISLPNNEKAQRVIDLVNALENLELVVKGSLDNCEPLFIIGGLSNKKTHIFENLIKYKNNKLVIHEDLKERAKNYHCGILSSIFDNEQEIKQELNATSISSFFDTIRNEIKQYYNVE